MNPQLKKIYQLLTPFPGWASIIVFCLMTTVLVLAGAGKITNILFPAGAVGVGLFLYSRYPVLYVGFTWWVWFLAPLIRRLVDFRSGFSDPSLILLAPYLVTLICGLTFLKQFPKAGRIGAEPFVLAVAAVFYAYLVALNKSSLVASSIGILDWITPIIFGFYIFSQWRDYPEYQNNTEITFVWCVLITGTYGIYQYLVAPAWDAFWLTNADISSAGSPVPFGIRVWSTMHGPGVFGSVMMAGLIILMNIVSPLSIPANAAGFLSLLLSLARTAWLGWAISCISLFSFLKPKMQMRLVTLGVIIALTVVPLTTLDSFSSVINSRIQSLSNLQGDSSASARQSSYELFFKDNLMNVVGNGIATGGTFDSAVIDSINSLGWIGTLSYWSGVLGLYVRILWGHQQANDTFLAAARSICIGMGFQLIGGSVMLGLPGVVMWAFLGLAAAAQKFYQSSVSQQYVMPDGSVLPMIQPSANYR
jgi:hypothetical protein